VRREEGRGGKEREGEGGVGCGARRPACAPRGLALAKDGLSTI